MRLFSKNQRFAIVHLIFLISSIHLYSQPIRTYNFDGLMRGAELALEKKDYFNAADLLERAYKERKNPELALQIANLNNILRDYNKAEIWFKRGLAKDKDMTMPEAHFALGRILKINGKHDEATQVLQRYLTVAEEGPLRDLARTELKGIDLIKKMPEQKKLIAENAGKDINCLQSDFGGTFDSEGNLYFSSMNRDSIIRLNGKEGDYFTKIYVSSKGVKGFEKPVPMSSAINKENTHTANPSFSVNGDKLFFSRAELDGNEILTSKIFVASKIQGEWANATELPKINGEFLSKHPSTGELYGKEVLFFTSNMPGSLGGFDVFYANIYPSGEIGEPVSLGKTINTPGDEATPFYENGNLYFSSTGHPGMGGFDIFVSKWNGSEWSEPKNLGKVYNSSWDDSYFTKSLDGSVFALSSNREGTKSVKSKTCCDDIYLLRERKVEIDLNVLVLDKKAELKGVTVELAEIIGKSIGSTREFNNEESGKFNIPLFPEKLYRVYINKDGFLKDSFEINTVQITEAKVFDKKIELKAKPKPVKEEYETITSNKPIRLNNIYYDYDDDKILPDAEQDLAYLMEILNKYPTMVIELSSHTDSRGKDDYNRELSQRRAESAKTWLVNKGITSNRIQAVGYGEANLLNQCKNGVKCTDAEHRINRRTEFKILSGPTNIQVKKTVIKGTNKEVNLPQDNKKTGQVKPSNEPSIAEQKNKPPTPPIVKLPILSFESKDVDLGTIKKGQKKNYSYKFTNTGNAPLIIDIVNGCECTTITWTRGEIAPGAKGSIDIIYDTKDEKIQSWDKTIDIAANTKPRITNLSFKAIVVE